MLEEFNDPDFVRCLKARSESAYRKFFDEFSPWARSFAKKKYSLSEEDARDLVQDFFHRIVEKIDLYDEQQGRFLPWCFQIFRNLIIDWLRHRMNVSFASFDAWQNDALVPSYEDDPTIRPRDDLSPLERLPIEIRTAYLKLNARYQQLLGFWLMGTSDDAVKEVLNLPSDGALWTLRSRALAKLKEEVEKSAEHKGVTHEYKR